MKKYRVTSKHPVYKAGLKIEQKHENCFHLLGSKNELYLNTCESIINGWLKDGWIEEIQEPIFTKDDMKRKNGFYWVRYQDEWIIAQMDHGSWLIPGNENCIDIGCFDIIDEIPIVAPVNLVKFSVND